MTHFISFFQHVDWAAILMGVIDVGIVALIIYRVLLLLRGTKAAYMLLGLLAVISVYLLAKLLALGTVSWLLDHVLRYALLIVIVVFQREIRSGLLRVGRKLIRPHNYTNDAGIAHLLISTAKVLANERIGALIVIEKDDDLSKQHHLGVKVDSVLSEELLRALFTPSASNPLHDGAVIIRDNRIMQAGVLLPLCRSSYLERELGTRHRAALGITDESDAVAIVVSEERGAISLCYGGTIETDIDDERFIALLESFTCSSSKLEAKELSWMQRAARHVIIGEPRVRQQKRPIAKERFKKLDLSGVS